MPAGLGLCLQDAYAPETWAGFLNTSVRSFQGSVWRNVKDAHQMKQKNPYVV